MRIRAAEPNAAYEALMADLKAALAKYSDLDAIELLAVVSILVGNLIAFQDQTRFTPTALLELVGSNIECGNKTAIDSTLGQTIGGRQ